MHVAVKLTLSGVVSPRQTSFVFGDFFFDAQLGRNRWDRQTERRIFEMIYTQENVEKGKKLIKPFEHKNVAFEVESSG
jgi:hypothetical protein